jgi:hypothetical protein
MGLSAADTDVQRNEQLLKDRPWFNIPIVYTNGGRAILDASVCVVDASGKIVREGKVASEPVTLITWLGSLGVNLGADQWPILSDRRLRRDGFASSFSTLGPPRAWL